MVMVTAMAMQTAMNEMAQRGKKANDAALRAAQQTSTAMQYLQMQQQQLAVSPLGPLPSLLRLALALRCEFRTTWAWIKPVAMHGSRVFDD